MMRGYASQTMWAGPDTRRRTVLGGLFFATLLTLFVVPAFYSIFNRHLKGKHQRDAQIAAVTMPGA
jgi:hypothetical protein